jgi:hypothetical protein
MIIRVWGSWLMTPFVNGTPVKRLRTDGAPATGPSLVP